MAPDMQEQCVDQHCALANQQIAGTVHSSADCCSIVFTGTKRIDGRLTASQIAAANDDERARRRAFQQGREAYYRHGDECNPYTGDQLRCYAAWRDGFNEEQGACCPELLEVADEDV